MSKCDKCPHILNSDWPIGGGILLDPKEVEALRKAVNAAEPHEHFEGMNECSICDEGLLVAAARIIRKNAPAKASEGEAK